MAYYQVPVWHVGKEEDNDKIIAKQLVTTNEEGIWLGDCLYFWDNSANAKYWSERYNGAWTCLEATLKFSDEEFLDMTDQEINKAWSEVWEEMVETLELPTEEEYSEGEKLNILWKTLKGESKRIMSVIKAYGVYRGGQDNFYYQSYQKRRNKPHIDNTKVRTMYGVREISVIDSCVVKFTYQDI